MKKKLIWLACLALATSLASASCTHKVYHPTKKTDREWRIDHDECQKWAREGIRDVPDTYDKNDEMRIIWNCMKDKGWQWERTDLFDFKQAPSK